METLGFDTLAETSGAIVAYPNAVQGSWNDERIGVDSVAHIENIDDLGFIEKLIATEVTDDNIDPSQVAMIGFSNGALFAADFACTHAHEVRVVVLAAGVGGIDLPERCQPANAVSILEVHSLHDPTVPYTGGKIGSSDGKTRGQAAPVDTMIGLWRTADQCPDPTTTTLTNTTPRVVEHAASPCLDGTAVTAITIDNALHTWPTAPVYNMTAKSWQFIIDHISRSSGPP